MHSPTVLAEFSPQLYTFELLASKQGQTVISAVEQKPTYPVSHHKTEQNSPFVVKETLHKPQTYSENEEQPHPNHTRHCLLLHNEHQILSQLSSPYIIESKSTLSTSKESCFIILEQGLVDMYDLTTRSEILAFNELRLPEICTAILHAASALNYMHTQFSIAHNDIKPENIIAFSPNHYKLADFGYAKPIKYQFNSLSLPATTTTNNSQQSTEMQLTTEWKRRCKQYMAPELIELIANQRTSRSPQIDESKSDIFSLGISLFVMIFNVLPFQTEAGARFDDPIFQHLYHPSNYTKFWACFDHLLSAFQSTFPNHPLPAFKNLIENMLCPFPETRFSADQVLDHPWISMNQLQTTAN